jgi:hypothetical protein
MQNVPSSIVDMYQNHLQASRQFADAIFSGTEKIDHVVLDATHRAFTEQLQFAQALASARDSRELANLPSGLLPRPESAANYQREILQVFAEIQSEIGKSIQQYVEQLSNSAASAARTTAESGQQRSATAFNPVTGMFSVWESAFKEVAALANKNMVAARSTFENAARNAAGTANAAADNADNASDLIDDAEEGGGPRKSPSSRRK